MVFPLKSFAQNYNDALFAYRNVLKLAFVANDNSPLTAEDTANLRYFEPDETYVVRAKVQLIKRGKIMPFNTSSNKIKYYKPYARLDFEVNGKPQVLVLYEAQQLKKQKAYKHYLFLPFYDLTNYEQTYGMGRYLELDKRNIVDGTLVIDFNKAYNPYCAYKGGYSCPIPPKENTLSVSILAGEQTYPHPELNSVD